MEQLGMTPKGLANEWAVRPSTKLGNTTIEDKSRAEEGRLKFPLRHPELAIRPLL